MIARLVALAGPRCGEAFPVEGSDVVLGRDPAADVSVPDRLMSRRHCTLLLRNGRYSLRDLGSANGTFVNGLPVQERALEHGDRIRLGESVLMFVRAAFPATAENVDVPSAVDDRTTRIPTGASDRARTDPGAEGTLPLMGSGVLPPVVMIGESPAIRQVHERIARIAASDYTVLITGETGTGKELAARAIHQRSARAARPFVAINCAALTEALLESELFGHERGAFTGAHAQKKGKFELADRGTIFLDEVGELAPALQAKLLRALQQHEFERVGGTRTVRVDVRVVAATNRDLGGEVAAGRFRQDLWYRLNVVTLVVPPLRERREDLPVLARYFATAAAEGRRIELSDEAIDALTRYDWPGNVRQLENVIARAVVLGASDRIELQDVSEEVAARDAGAQSEGASFHAGVREVKRRMILDAIDRSGGNYTAAARLLGLNPTYLHRLARTLRLKDDAARR